MNHGECRPQTVFWYFHNLTNVNVNSRRTIRNFCLYALDIGMSYGKLYENETSIFGYGNILT